MPYIVEGHCPMGCGNTLQLLGNQVRCVKPNCPRPTAVHEVLADYETEHVVTFGDTDFTLKHPLKERLDDQLLHCELHSYLSHAGPPPADMRTGIFYRIIEENTSTGVVRTYVPTSVPVKDVP